MYAANADASASPEAALLRGISFARLTRWLPERERDDCWKSAAPPFALKADVDENARRRERRERREKRDECMTLTGCR
jgi:hypothetical protein